MAIVDPKTGYNSWISMRNAYIILNILRGFSIFSLTSVIVVFWFIVVNSFITDTFFFFDFLSYIILSIISLFLIMTELPQRFLPLTIQYYLMTHWPLLSITSGLKTLSLTQMAIGIFLLGYINNGERDASTRRALGETWWRVMVSAGAFLGFVALGNLAGSIVCVNIDDGGKILSARQLRDPVGPLSIPPPAAAGRTLPHHNHHEQISHQQQTSRSPALSPRSTHPLSQKPFQYDEYSQSGSTVYGHNGNGGGFGHYDISRSTTTVGSEVGNIATTEMALKSSYASVPISSPAPVALKSSLLTRPVTGEGGVGGRWL
ncbi:hypothetical protein DFH27DRAFT_151120 [Peziza echinospora]|nr:hypothetical protein DFH27DRAFT_151120 [Peziza echinospora]